MRSPLDAVLRSKRSGVVLFAFSAVIGGLLLGGAHRGAYDFQAFYCAGKALTQGADPYRTEPLRTCEHRQTDGTYASLPAGIALPAPQPPYDIALFALFSALPFGVAKALWGAALGLALAIAIALLARVTRAPPGSPQWGWPHRSSFLRSHLVSCFRFTPQRVSPRHILRSAEAGF